MSPREDRAIPISILDRLTDLDPASTKDAVTSPWQLLRDFKASLCRDLAALLNTRRAEEDFDPAFEESAHSLLTFGIVDFTSGNLKDGFEQERVRRSIERAIRQFEPRLVRLSVSLEDPDPLMPMLHFQIEAWLPLEAGLEPVLFDATLYRDTRRVGVSGVNA